MNAYPPVWAEATSDAIDAVTVAPSPAVPGAAGPIGHPAVIIDHETSGPGPDRKPLRSTSRRVLTPTNARVLAARLTEAADVAERVQFPDRAARDIEAILWPAGDPDHDWSPGSDTLEAIADAMQRAGYGPRP